MKSTKLLAAVACLMIFNLTLVSASCNEEQININEASKTELQKIDQVGTTYAERIIDLRPFESLDDLTEVKGIAEGRLETIKNQSLACVEMSSSENQNKDEEPTNETTENREENSNEETDNEPEVNLERNPQEETSEENQQNTQQDKITLSAKDIKNQTANDESIDKSKYSQYGLVGLTILVILLFLLREVKHRKYKNEFSG